MKTKANDKIDADILVSEFVGSPKYKTDKYYHEQKGGLTKREYFAAMAMQGLLANETLIDILSGNNGMQVPNLIAEYSIQYTNALIEELNKS